MLLYDVFDFIRGYSVAEIIRTEGESDREYDDKVSFLMNLLLSSGIMYVQQGEKRTKRKRRGEQQRITLKISRKDCKKLRRLLDKRGSEVYIIYDKGIPAIIGRYRRRPGIAAGCLLFSVLVGVASGFCWSVEVSGMTTEESLPIIEKMKEAGCGIGTYLPATDLYRVCNRFLVLTEDYSWVSVNIDGTKATVSLRRTEKKTAIPDPDTPVNVVASRSGEIVSVTAGAGRPVVKDGDGVSAGQLLISGVVDNKNGSFRLTRAQGKVLAVTKDCLSVSVPLDHSEKYPSGKSASAYTLSVLGKQFDLPGGRKLPENDYITETTEDYPLLFGFIRLPVLLKTVKNTVCTEQTRRLSENEAREAAGRLLAQRIAETAADGELLRTERTDRMTGSEYVAECEITVLRDISKESPLGVVLQTAGG